MKRRFFFRTNGSTGTIVDAWLDVDRLAAQVTKVPTGNAIVDNLPDIRGFGDLSSLRVAMFEDGALATMVSNAVKLSVDQIHNLHAVAEQIIYRWAEVQDIATNSRGTSFDGRKLAALEKFVGHSFINTVNATNPTAQAAPFLNRAWDELLDSVHARLAIAGTLKGVLPIVYNTGADRFISLYDVDQVLSTLKNAQPSDTLQAAKFWGAFLPVISRIVDDAGGNSAAADHVAKVNAALAEMGLDKFQNNLVNGIQLAIPPTSGSFIKNGAYQLSDSAETLSVNGNASQAIYGLGGNDVLTAIAPNTVAFFLLDGGTGNDVLRGSSNADWLNGGTGADLMVGGAGDDIYYVDDAGDVVRENRNEGNDSVRSTITYTLGDNVENLELLGMGNLNGTGNALANTITGNTGVNILIGNDGNDNLDGGGNADTLVGGLGNDTYTIDNVADVIVEKFNEGVDTVQSRISLVLVNSLENLVLQGAENINGTGNSGNNSITGNVGKNILDGKAGNDTLKGDAGDDIYWVDSSADKVIEIANGGLDIVNSSTSFTLGVNVENLTLFGDADINGIGNASNNILLGNAGANTLDGKAGVDAMSGGASDDMYYVDNIADVVTEINDVGVDTVNSSVSFVLGDYIENLTLLGTTAINGTGNNLDNEMIGNTGANNLVGNAGNDVLDGKAGADTLSGGLGDDGYVVDNVADIITEASNAGKDTVQSSVTWILGANLENLVLSGVAAINATGNELANRLTGNNGKNQLDGKAGADILMGLGGDDVYLVDTKDSIIENFNEGIDTVQSSFNYVLGDNIENLVLLATALNGTGNKLNNTLTGNDKANTLIGNDGNDILDGAAGADILNGGKGNDTYMVDNIADAIIEGWNGGIDKDTVQSSISYTLGKNLENLLLLGTDAINAIGNTSNNILTGNAGNNILDGKAGDDVMKGGAGDDIYYVDSSLDVLSEAASAGTDSVFSNVSYLLGNNVEKLTLLGEDDINATGNNLNNILLGNKGVNTLDGKAGADTLNGGLGDDVYFVDNIGDIIIENADAGVDTVNSTITYMLSNTLENLTLLGAGAINGIGNDMDNILIGTTGNNILTGNAGNDFLNGGTGADNLNGGIGDDIYVVDNVNDVITEASNAGIDTVQSSIAHILLSNFENLVLIGTVSIDAKGNALDNIITGNTASNVLDGQGGADKLIGLAGNDTYLLDNVNDTVWEDIGGGLDIVITTFSYVLGENLEKLVLQGSGNLTGTGNDLNNNITGNAGANIINGGNGNDTLTGGAGADIFQLTNAANIDSIIDFSVLDDTLQLDNSVFASLGAEGVLAAAKLRVGAGITAAADANDYLIYNSTDGKLYYDADAIGANAAVQIALLGKGLVLTSADFVVI